MLWLALLVPSADLFRDRVAPLLSARCLACHDGARKRGGVDLSSLKGWDALPDKGKVLEMVAGPKPRMPRLGPRLAAAEVAILTEWIEAGAAWPAGTVLKEKEDWWSLRKLDRPAVPEARGAAWCRNPVDRFLLRRLETEALAPSPEAPRAVLLRRLCFDLTGLPPSLAMMDAFLKDERPDAYERLLDALLASPAYGERWGRHWLDVARYADTHGYDKDKRRDDAWPYRDWVVSALNEGLPWPDFVRMQLAGDMLRPGSREGLAASGFVVAGPWDFVGHVELREGTVDKQKARVNDRDDMLTAALGAFASSTVGCARCHDHKFDPIPTRDYYRLQAVFAGAKRGSRRLPGMLAPSRSNGYHSAVMPTADHAKWVQVDLGSSLALDEVRLFPARPVDFADTPGFGFPLRFKIEAGDDPAFKAHTVLLDKTAADVANPGDRPLLVPAKGTKARYVRVTATRLWKRTGDFAFALAELQVIAGGRLASAGKPVAALDSIEAGRWSKLHLVDGATSRHVLPEPLTNEVLEGRIAPASTATVYAPVSIAPRPVHLLHRGDVEQPKEVMKPGALSCLPLPSDFSAARTDGERRLALADWLVHQDNPLSWRSATNRLWHWHFGRGLADTPSDFGRMGSPPSHLELLDWLACELRGGSLKRLHRLVCASAAYRQASGDGPGARLDSDNRLLWRAPRRRLDAETLRDAVLAASGELRREMGGRGYDLFRFKDDHSPTYDHDDAKRMTDPATYRRTVYRFAVRSVPNPFLECLDGPDPNQPVPVRTATLTALQALALMNNPFMVEQAARLAKRLEAVEESGRIAEAYRLLFARRPTAEEQRAVSAHARKHGLAAACRVLLNANEFVFVD